MSFDEIIIENEKVDNFKFNYKFATSITVVNSTIESYEGIEDIYTLKELKFISCKIPPLDEMLNDNISILDLTGTYTNPDTNFSRFKGKLKYLTLSYFNKSIHVLENIIYLNVSVFTSEDFKVDNHIKINKTLLINNQNLIDINDFNNYFNYNPNLKIYIVNYHNNFINCRRNIIFKNNDINVYRDENTVVELTNTSLILYYENLEEVLRIIELLQNNVESVTIIDSYYKYRAKIFFPLKIIETYLNTKSIKFEYKNMIRNF